MRESSFSSFIARITATGSIFVFFIMAFEIMIMISPFAFFFYSIFNPLFKFIDNYPTLSWLTSFFLPHMILPSTNFLIAIRILGSVLFVVGALTFFICAFQVYIGKIFRLGIANKGLYKIIRHPQYLALGIWGIGMSILWPRFIVLAGLSIMLILYYFLAKDEEKRMTLRYGSRYQEYIQKTGMFFPVTIEKWVRSLMPHNLIRSFSIPILIIVTVMGTGFILRDITLHSLKFSSNNNIILVSILPEDNYLNSNVLNGLFNKKTKQNLKFLNDSKDYLAYLMPADYIMQGMIANTGSDFHLYKKNHTFSLIMEWVFHPFRHLRTSPSFHMAKMQNVNPQFARRHHCPIDINVPTMQCNTCPYRRVIIVEVDNAKDKRLHAQNILSFNTKRIPICYIDLNAQTGEIINIKQVESTTAWKDVPTPAI